MERGDRGRAVAQRNEQTLQEEEDEDEHAEPDLPPPHPADDRQRDEDQRQPPEDMAELGVRREVLGAREHSQAGQEDLHHQAGHEQPGTVEISGPCPSTDIHRFTSCSVGGQRNRQHTTGAPAPRRRTLRG